MSTNAEVDALALFQSELKDLTQNDLAVKTVNKMTLVAAAIGPRTVCTDLVPYIADLINRFPNDEGLASIARQMQWIFELAGGASSSAVQDILNILETLAGEEEVIVRTHACNSLNAIIPKLSKGDVANKVTLLYKRLSTGVADWFATKVSACNITGTLFQNLAGNEALQNEVKSAYIAMTSDEAPMVRRAAAQNIGSLAQHLSKAAVKNELIPVVRTYALDERDQMRLLAPAMIADIQPYIDHADFATLILPMLEGLLDDGSWRVRQALAQSFARFCVDQSDAFVSQRLLPIYFRLSKDKNLEVRLAVTSAYANVARALATAPLLPEDPLAVSRSLQSLPWSGPAPTWHSTGATQAAHEHIEGKDKDAPVVQTPSAQSAAAATAAAQPRGVPLASSLALLVGVADTLARDPSPAVRMELAVNFSALPPLFGRTHCIDSLIPVHQLLCRDPTYEIRACMMDSIAVIHEIIGSPTLQATLLPTILELAKDPKWRVRMSVVENYALLAKILGAKIFERRIQPALALALSDHVQAVREATCQQISAIINELGARWCVEKLFPPAMALNDRNQNYLHRMTCLYFILNSALVCPPDIIETHLLPVVTESLQDDVANVRVAGAKCLIEILPRINRRLVDSIKPLLVSNAAHEDHDVAYFSTLALKLCK